MGAKTVLSQQQADDGFSLLKDIVEMVKNPKAIDEAYERRRKAAELTDEEVAEATEARALIANAAEIKADIKRDEDALLRMRVELDDDKKSHATLVALETERLSEWHARLVKIEEGQTQLEKTLNAEKKRLEDYAAHLDAQYQTKVASLNNREAAVDDGEKANAAEAERLAKLSQKLKDKAARLAAEAELDE